MTQPNTAHCTQCDRQSRISEPYAFNGMSRTLMTLSCGHVVARSDVTA